MIKVPDIFSITTFSGWVRNGILTHMRSGTGIAMGIAIGVALGAAMDNIALGIALGISVGVAMEASKSFNKKDKK
jgi:hypothetical protein